MADLFITREDHDLGDTRPPLFSVARIRLIIGRLSGLEDPFLDDRFRWLNWGVGIERTASEIAEIFRGLVNSAISDRGRVTVRYIGDLKPTEYPTDVQFFSISAGTDQQEFSELLRHSLISGGGKRTLINLANVRDITIDVGRPDTREIGSDIAWLGAIADTFESWGDVYLIFKEGP